MREKHMWEVQLRNLGGPNYMRFGPRTYDEDGREVPNSRGYKYFGRARELPGVKELFEELKPKVKEKQRVERKNVDADYYGYSRDEEDGVLLRYEEKKEAEVRATTAIGEEPGLAWSAIPDWSVPDLWEVESFLVERQKSKLLQKLS